MPQLWKLVLQNPIRSFKFLHAWIGQVIVIVLKRIILPGFPQHQSFRLQLQRAYWSSSSYYFPEIIHRLPVTDCPSSKARRVGSDWTGYVIPGTKSLEHLKNNSESKACLVIYAHGGGYARGEARMYINYMQRWLDGAAKVGLEITFLSVEYPLTDEAPHPAQRQAFLAAYQNILDQGVPPERVIFMGDSAGGGLCVLSALEVKKRGLPQPAGSVLISPWLDMRLQCFKGGNALVETDYIVGANVTVPKFTASWLNGAPGDSSDVNPLCRTTAEVRGLNPLLILVGGGEFALQEGKDLAALCKAADVPHHLEIEWGQMHLYGLGSKWISPLVRQKTDALIYSWMVNALNA